MLHHLIALVGGQRNALNGLYEGTVFTVAIIGTIIGILAMAPVHM